MRFGAAAALIRPHLRGCRAGCEGRGTGERRFSDTKSCKVDAPASTAGSAAQRLPSADLRPQTWFPRGAGPCTHHGLADEGRHGCGGGRARAKRLRQSAVCGC